MTWEQARREVWNCHFNPPDEDAFLEPSHSATAVAFQVLDEFEQAACMPPHAVVMDGDGGIVIEWRKEDDWIRVEIDEQGKEEGVRFRGRERVYRGPVKGLLVSAA